MGTQVMVFVHDHNLIKEAFNRPDFQERPQWKTFNFLEDNPLGVINSSGERWHNNRRFTLRQLRDLGMGKSKLEAAVHTQARQLVHELQKQAGRPAQLPNALNVAVVNIIWQMVGGKQFPMKDPMLKEFDELFEDFVASFGNLFIPDFLPWLHYIVPSCIMKRVFKFSKVEVMKKKLTDFFYEEIVKHRAIIDKENPRDMIDSYLIEMEKREDDPNSLFSEKELVFLLVDMFIAGSETIAASLKWLIYYLACHPQVQAKMQAEIDQVLPKGTLPTLQDKAKLPYTEAVIQETLRMSSLSVFGGGHVAKTDTTLGGYTIPKGTIVNLPVSSLHHNPRYWDQPELFHPDRWMDQHGNTTLKRDGFAPFSIGRRQCAGEGLARMELFIFSVAIFQSLTISVPPPKTQLNLSPLPGAIFMHFPAPQNILVTARG